MYIYFILIIFWFFSLLIGQNLSEINQKKYHAFFLGGSMFLVMALRHYSVGSDIEHYLDVYNDTSLWNASFIKQFEFGYFSLLWIFKFLGVGNQGYIIIISLMISISFSTFFYRYSKNIFLSFYLHLTIGLFVITMSAVRQSLAICVILISIQAFLDKRYFRFLFFVLIASTFHLTALFFLPVYFFKRIKTISIKKGFFLYIILLSFFFVKDFIINCIIYISPVKYKSLYTINNESNPINILLILISLIIPLFLLIFWKSENDLSKEEKRENAIFYILSLCSSFIMILALNVPMISRFSYYFIISYIVLIPNVIYKLENKNNKIIIISFLCVFCFIYFLMGTIDGTLMIDNYKFFWQ